MEIMNKYLEVTAEKDHYKKMAKYQQERALFYKFLFAVSLGFHLTRWWIG